MIIIYIDLIFEYSLEEKKIVCVIFEVIIWGNVVNVLIKRNCIVLFFW